MNRRQLLLTGASMVAVSSRQSAMAIDVDVVESPIMSVLRMLPDLPGQDGFDFPVTIGQNLKIFRELLHDSPNDVVAEEREEIQELFAIDPADINLTGSIGTATLWQLDNTRFDWESSRATLVTNGWEEIDTDLNLLQFTGDETQRSDLANPLTVLGHWIRGGSWDWIAFPDVANVVLGSNQDHVSTVADRVQNYPPMTSIDSRFHQLKYALRVDTYQMMLLPPQKLSVPDSESLFVSAAWTDNGLMLQSIGFRLKSEEHIDGLVSDIQSQMARQKSTMLNLPYSDFLTIESVDTHDATLRIDLLDSSGDWDIFAAVDNGDLRFLPIPRRYDDYPSGN